MSKQAELDGWKEAVGLQTMGLGSTKEKNIKCIVMWKVDLVSYMLNFMQHLLLSYCYPLLA
jgi:hypothetical protein